MKKLLILALGLIIAGAALAQETTGEATDANTEGRPSSFSSVENQAVTAMTDPDYRVTPGDLIRVSYNQSFTPVSFDALVQYDFSLDLGPIGSLSARNRSFIQFRQEIEQAVRRAYPNSTPSVVLVSLGSFEVFVTGEVTEATRRRVNGFTRLAGVVNALGTAYSSNRNVAITYSDGTVRRYDLFLASRGDFDQNPLLRPGMRITVPEADRRVSISGAVRRSGTYQLLPGEGLSDLITTYAGGFTRSAYTQEVEIARSQGEEEAEVQYVADPLSAELSLNDEDSVRVLSRNQFLPIVSIEGALQQPNAAGTDEANPEEPQSVAREDLRVSPGTRLSSFIARHQGLLASDADLRHASYRRADGSIEQLDLLRLITAEAPEFDPVLSDGDVIIVPQRRFIYVEGEVSSTLPRAVNEPARLLDLFENARTDYSSLRDVQVRFFNGTQGTYDLFLAIRDGRMDQNPWVSPGDTVIVQEVQRRVSIAGQVRRPGSYQLLEGEGLSELITRYAGGLREDAYGDEVLITRLADADERSTRTLYVQDPLASDFELQDTDSVSVESAETFLPAIYVEGPIGGEEAAAFDEAPTRRVEIRFRPGQRLSTALRGIVGRLNPTAVLSDAVLIRDGVRIPIDLRPLIFSRTPQNDPEIAAEDIISIPARQLLVAVEGAVAQPGNYPYVVGQDMGYYIALAGGRIGSEATDNAGYVVTTQGTRRAAGEPIDAEDRIVVPTNNPLYYVQTYVGLVGSVASVVTSILLALNAVTGGN